MGGCVGKWEVDGWVGRRVRGGGGGGGGGFLYQQYVAS